MRAISNFILSIVFGYILASPLALPIIWIASAGENPPFWIWSAFGLPISLLAFIAMQKEEIRESEQSSDQTAPPEAR